MSGLTYIDSKTGTGTINNLQISLNGNVPIIPDGVGEFAIKKIVYDFDFKNVNDLNSSISYTSSNTGANIHVNLIDVGYYDNSSDLMDAIVTALNISTGTTGLTFSKTLLYGDTYTLNSSGGTFALIDSPYYNALWGPEIKATSASVTCHVDGYYTRYIDIVSFNLNKEDKFRNAANNSRGGSNLLYRLFPGSPITGVKTEDKVDEPLRWINKEDKSKIHNIDIELYDEFGNLLETELNNWYIIEMLMR